MQSWCVSEPFPLPSFGSLDLPPYHPGSLATQLVPWIGVRGLEGLAVQGARANQLYEQNSLLGIPPVHIQESFSKQTVQVSMVKGMYRGDAEVVKASLKGDRWR